MVDLVREVAVRSATPANCATVLAYLRARAVSGMEVVGTDVYARVIRCGDRRTEIVRVRFDNLAHTRMVRVSSPRPLERRDLEAVANRVFGLRCDVRRAETALAQDPVLGGIIIRQRGLRVPGTADPFELAVRAVLGQQLSVARAAQLALAVSRTWGDEVPEPEPGLTHAFPGPEALAEADLKTLGLPSIRRQAISTLARSVLDGHLTLDGRKSLRETTDALIAVPGIGPWTSAYIALRALGDLDSIPAQDLGLRTAASGDGVPVSPSQLALQAEAWRPWRGLAAVHLWTTLLP